MDFVGTEKNHTTCCWGGRRRCGSCGRWCLNRRYRSARRGDGALRQTGGHCRLGRCRQGCDTSVQHGLHRQDQLMHVDDLVAIGIACGTRRWSLVSKRDADTLDELGQNGCAVPVAVTCTLSGRRARHDQNADCPQEYGPEVPHRLPHVRSDEIDRSFAAFLGTFRWVTGQVKQ